MKQFIFAAIFFFLTLGYMANASDFALLEIVAENGETLHLNKSTVAHSTMGEAEGEQRSDEEPVYYVLFNLTDEAARGFRSLTRASIGKPIRIFLNGQLMSAPIVRSEIVGGKGFITPVSKKHAEAILAAMQH